MHVFGTTTVLTWICSHLEYTAICCGGRYTRTNCANEYSCSRADSQIVKKFNEGHVLLAGDAAQYVCFSINHWSGAVRSFSLDHCQLLDYPLPNPPHPQPAYPTHHPGGPFMEVMHLKQKYSSVHVRTRKKPNRTIENHSQWSGSGFNDFVEPNHGSVLGSRRGPSEPDRTRPRQHYPYAFNLLDLHHAQQFNGQATKVAL
ncbi:hypothetical protein EDD22DRAFT_847768 [Suillus occidentalis]|nr:hypothetical protein EDD22DRAFT_847768 [Suillus occidentalis]